MIVHGCSDCAPESRCAKCEIARLEAQQQTLVAALQEAHLKLTGALHWITRALDCCPERTVNYDGSGTRDGFGLKADLEDAIYCAEQALTALDRETPHE